MTEKKKLLFWIDFGFLHFGIANYLQKKTDAEFYAIIDINDKAKKFFEKQKLVEFKKSWYYLDETADFSSKPDLEYLKSFEKRYGIDLWSIAFTDRAFFRFNKYHKFSEVEIFSLLEKECKFFEKILEESKPDYLLLWVTNAHNTHLLHQMCKSKGVKILMLSQTRFGNRFIVSHDFDKFDKEDIEKISNDHKEISDEKLIEYLEKYDPLKIIQKKSKEGYSEKKSSRYKALAKFFFSGTSESYKKRFSYYGRSKSALLKEKILRKIQKVKIESYIDKKFLKKIQPETKFVYFPLHSEPERALLIGAPFFDDQFSMILYVSKCIPAGYKLYVKDHPAMKKYMWRSKSYYQNLIDVPNVEFLHPSVNRDDIMKKCDLVIGVGGTPVLEACFFKKPSIMFQENDMSIIPSIHSVENIKDLPQIIKKTLSEKVDTQYLKNYLKIVDSCTFEVDLWSLNTDFAYTFGFKGPDIDGELPVNKIKKFLEKHKDIFEKIADAHLSKINKG